MAVVAGIEVVEPDTEVVVAEQAVEQEREQAVELVLVQQLVEQVQLVYYKHHVPYLVVDLVVVGILA